MKIHKYIRFLSKRREEIFLIFILILALILRTSTIDYLIEYFILWDEVAVGGPAYRIVLTGDLNPHFFLYPSFHVYLMSFLIFLAQTIYPAIENSSLLLIGRSASVLFGCATVIVIYLIGKELFNKKVGLIAALFISLNSLHIYLSQLMKTDAAVIFWVLLAFLFAVKIMRRGLWRDYLYCGIISGIATATKYNFFPLIPAIIAHILYSLPTKEKYLITLKDRKIILLLFSSVVIFIITSPYVILDLKTFYQYIFEEYNRGQFGSSYQISSENWLHWRYFYQLFLTYPRMIGLPLMIFSISGIIFLGIKDRKKTIMMLSYPISFFIFSSSVVKTSFEHEHSTIIPFFCLFGSIFINELLANKIKIIKVLGYSSLFLAIIFSILSVSRSGCNFMNYHNAEEWVKNNIQRQSKITFFLPMIYPYQTKFNIVAPSGSQARLTREFLIKQEPDYIVISRRNFPKYQQLNRAVPDDILKDLLSGRLGYSVVMTFEGRYFLEELYSSLAAEFKCDKITILKRKK